MSSILGIDFGERRIGLAISGADGRVVMPLRTLDAAEWLPRGSRGKTSAAGSAGKSAAAESAGISSTAGKTPPAAGRSDGAVRAVLGAAARALLDGAVRAVLGAAREYDVSEYVVGLPLNMDGSEGAQAAAARAFAESLQRASGRPVHMQDERLSSFAADELAQAAEEASGSAASPGPVRHARRPTDALAAQVILQAWLDRSVH